MRQEQAARILKPGLWEKNSIILFSQRWEQEQIVEEMEKDGEQICPCGVYIGLYSW